MAEMLLINPRRRRRRNPVSAVSRRRRRNPIAAVSRRRRRRNPMPLQLAAMPRRRITLRRRNPVGALRRRVMRRRNPIGGGRMGGMLMAAIREAFIGGAGSIGVDLAMGQINKFLPATLQTRPGTVGAGDAVKALITVMLGHFLAGPTRGLSRKMAVGALTVQSATIMRNFLPATLTGQLGYYNPAMVTMGVPSLSSNASMGMGAYTRGSPLLSAYQRPGGATPLLSRMRQSAQNRENVYAFR